MEIADQFRVRLGQFAERTVQEINARRTVGSGAIIGRRFEAQAVQLLREESETARGRRLLRRLRAPGVTDGTGRSGVRAHRFRECGQHPRQQDVGGRIESEPGRAGRQRVAVQGATDRASMNRHDLDQARFAQSFEMKSNGVGVQSERNRELRGGPGGSGTGEFAVQRVAGFVAERLEYLQLHSLTVPTVGHIFKVETVFIHLAPADTGPTMTDQPTDFIAPPSIEDVRGMLGGVMDPELKASIVDLGMVHDIAIDPAGVATIHIALTTLGCPLQAEIRREIASKVTGLPGIADVKVRWVEMTQEQKSAAMQRARLNARENAPDTQIPATTRVLAVSSGKGGVGKSSVSVNLAAALAARGLRVGVLDADIWGFSVPRMLGVDGRLSGVDGKIIPHHREIAKTGGGAAGSLEIVSMGFLVEDESTALMWRGLILTKAVEQFLTDVRWGELDYLIVDMPPGTGDVQMGLARLLPQAEMLVVTTPARNAQKVATRVADMARRSYMKVVGVVENMSEFVAPDGQRFALFGRGGGAALAAEIDAPLVASIPLEPEVSEGGDTGQPIALSSPDSPAGAAFHALAARIVDELLPPVEMAGCTARMFDLVQKLA